MEDQSLMTGNGDHGEIGTFANGECSYDDEDEDLINVLEELEINDINSKSFRGLDAVRFDDDDDEEEDLLELYGSSNDGTSQALVPLESDQEDNEADIGSEEERDILKGIREDIEIKVREEMEEELKDYQQRMKSIQDGRLPGRTDDEKNNDATMDENDEMNPQLREAIIKMNKLDKILRKKVKREREVKKERILLERRMRQEISEMDQGASKYREIKMNTEKFLALAPPPSHNEGVSLESEDEEEMPPLFQTQFDDSELDRRKTGRRNTKDDKNADQEDNSQPRSGSSISSQGARSRASKSGINMGSRTKAKKDFIKRNKELAGEADQPVAMTDDEKRRLQSLLEGVDELPEIEEGADITSLIELNPFQLSVQPGEGFCPDISESRTLSSIDQRLKGLMPEEDFRSIINGVSGSARGRDSAGTSPSQPLFTRVGLHSTGNDAAALERFGERVLYETKEERELKARLLAIESQLEQFKTPQEMEDESARDCHLTDEQLDELLDQCARNMTHTIEADTPEFTPRSQLSSRQSLLANPPKLTDEQLQQLLSDAQFPLSSRLLALRDDDQKLEEEDGSTEMIRAETWIAIRDAQLDDNAGIEDGGSMQEGSNNKLKSSNVPKPVYGESKYEDSGQSKNLSTNNAYCSNSVDASSREDIPESQEIDDFAFSPDITNPLCVSSDNAQLISSHSPLPGPSRTLGVEQERERDMRGASGGARTKNGSSVELPRLPHPPQFSSSSIRGSAEPDNSMRLGASSLASSSRSSFESSPPFLSNSRIGSVDGAQNAVKLPEILSKSFLIHTPQGMNNEESSQPKHTLPSRAPLQMVRNNLSDMSVTSMSASDREDNATPISGQSAVNINANSLADYRGPQNLQIRQPTPPSTKKQK